ncbi:MAG: hypothetical protein V7720_02190 [Halioglobus sp.]
MTDSDTCEIESTRTLFIHGGMHKTGSSAIQRYLYEHLDHPTFEYLSAGRPNASNIVLEAFHSRLGDIPRYKTRMQTQEALQSLRVNARNRFKKRMALTQKPNVILSAESFSLLNKDECTSLMAEVSKVFSVVKLVLYIRPVRPRVESAFQQKLKIRFVELEHKVRPSFRQRIAKYDDIFGKENVIIRAYDPSNFPGGSVINDFLAVVGLNIQVDSSPRANVGLSLPAVQLLYVYRRQFQTAIPEDKKLIVILGALNGDRFRMHQELLDRILVDNDEDYHWLEQRTGISVSGVQRHADYAVREEQDLLDVPQSSLRWLQQQQNDFQFTPERAPDLQAIAEALRKLALSS